MATTWNWSVLYPVLLSQVTLVPGTCVHMGQMDIDAAFSGMMGTQLESPMSPEGRPCLPAMELLGSEQTPIGPGA